jgi:nucleotide-binding universal stress UspA family protein
MSNPILAAYDPESKDPGPARFALAAARFTGAPVLIVSVCAIPVEGTYPVPPEPDLRPEAEAALRALLADLDMSGFAVETRAVRGTSAPSGLHEVAEQERAALLVVGSTDRGAVGRVLPGSTAERLMHGASCPVAVVPHEWGECGGLHKIGVAYVDTDEGRNALRGAHALARRAGATLRVLTVARAGAGARAETEAPRPGRPGKGFAAVEGEHRAQAEASVRNVASQLAGDVPIEVDAFLEDPADVLIRVSEHLDLLVCGSRGYGPLRAVLLGGVTRRVSAAAHCPVLVLPRGVELALDGAGVTQLASTPAS